MDILEKVKKALMSSKQIQNPIFNLLTDDEGNIIGSVASSSFENMDDETAQKTIWQVLKKNMTDSELVQISMIIHETRRDYLNSLNEKRKAPSNSESPLLLHHKSTPTEKYLLFVDVFKKEKTYYSEYFVIFMENTTSSTKSLRFEYSPELISLMQTKKKKDLEKEIYDHARSQAENEVSLHIMDKYFELQNKGLFGNSNPYHYVFSKLIFVEPNWADLTLPESAIKEINKSIKGTKSDKIKKEMQRIAGLSKIKKASID